MPVKNASGRVRQHIWYTSNTTHLEASRHHAGDAPGNHWSQFPRKCARGSVDGRSDLW